MGYVHGLGLHAWAMSRARATCDGLGLCVMDYMHGLDYGYMDGLV